MRLYCPKCQKVFSAAKPAEGAEVKCPDCGSEQHYPEVIPGPGVVVGDFLIEKPLSKGGMGEVFLAKQISLDRPVALKVLQQKHIEDKEYIESLFHEARAAAKLNHPNIVQAYAVGEDEGIYYFAMEYIRGETFKQILKREKTIEFVRAATVIRDIAKALDFAWREQKLVHQDIKPENIMLDANGFAKLADLGLAKVATGSEDGSEEGDEVLGTPQYISPEQLTGVPTDVRSDIYSLGATFYHFVTGRFPYVADTGDEIARMHIEAKLQPPKEVNTALPDALNSIIVKMMEKDINKRYQGADELVRDLDAYLRTASMSAAKPGIKLARPGAKPPQPAKPPVLKTPGAAAPSAGLASQPPKPAVPKVAVPPSVKPAVPASTPPQSSKPAVPKENTPPPETKPAEPETPAAPEEGRGGIDPEKLRKIVKIVLTSVAAVILVAVIAVAGRVICHQSQVRPDALAPAGRYFAGWFNFSGTSKPAPKVAPVRKTAAVPAVPKVRTRPGYIKKIVDIIKLYDVSPDDPRDFLAAADAFLASGDRPVTAEEREAFSRLIAAFAPADERSRFVPFRNRSRERHLVVLAEAERIREQERQEREARAREEAEALRERQAREEEERRRLQAERRREDAERAKELQQRVDAVLKPLIVSFFAAVNGDRTSFDAAMKAANDFVIPSSVITPEERRIIGEFKSFRSDLPAELEKIIKFRRKITDMQDGFVYSPPRGRMVKVVSMLPDGRLVCRAIDDDRQMIVPRQNRAALPRLMRGLKSYTGDGSSVFYYLLMIRDFEGAVKSGEMPNFWKRHLKTFARFSAVRP